MLRKFVHLTISYIGMYTYYEFYVLQRKCSCGSSLVAMPPSGRKKVYTEDFNGKRRILYKENNNNRELMN